MKKIPVRKEISELLHQAGIRPSGPRCAVMQYLTDHRTHPAADTIYTELAPFYPSLSKTTVYNTLKLLDAHGLVKTLAIDPNEARYDADVGFHAHFKCRICGGVFDLFPDSFSGLPNPGSTWKTEKVSLDFYGVCPNCSGNAAK